MGQCAGYARNARKALLMVGVLLLALVGRARGESSLTNTPHTVEDLRNIEKQVEAVARKATPATVGIILRTSQGSGVVISKDGYILTAGHVAGQANQVVTVVFSNGKRVRARTLGINRTLDEAMVKIIDPGEWPFVEIGKSGELEVGDWCVALGHTGGFRRDRSPPVRLGRLLVNSRTVEITSCTLMGGDSGGPLFDLDGKVIGIHSRIGQTTTANMHVPIDLFIRDWDRLKKGEAWGARLAYKGNAMLGVGSVANEQGCLVQTVLNGSAAQKGGIKTKDIITRFDEQAVNDPDYLGDLILRHLPYDEVKVELLRDGKAMELTIKLGAKP